jgi:hypothetical protein
MPMCAYDKSKKVKVGPTAEEANVKTVEVSLGSPGAIQLRGPWIRTRRECVGWGTDVGQVSKTVLDLFPVF